MIGRARRTTLSTASFRRALDFLAISLLSKKSIRVRVARRDTGVAESVGRGGQEACESRATGVSPGFAEFTYPADFDSEIRTDPMIVLVAGGTGGLGRAVSLAFLEAGWRAAVTYRRAGELDELRAAAGTGADRLEGHSADVTDEAAVERLIADLVTRHGRLDALVNAVGGWTGGAKAWEAGGDELDRMLAVNVKAGWVLSRAAARAMVRQGAGVIVNVASKAGTEPTPGAAAYAASKAAAIALIDSLAADLKGTGVRANSILPSIIDTEANRQAMPKANYAKWPKPEEIARVILFLCGDDAAVLHGAAIPVYGDR